MTPRIEHLAEGVVLLCGDCLSVLKTLEANSIDALVTDPPYGLEFMGKGWDGADGFRRSLNAADVGRENVFGRTSRRSPEYRAGRLLQVFLRAVAIEAMRVLKPGGYVLAFGGTRTYHRMACAIEDAGFEVRDMISWLYGSGFPKSLDVSKAIDKAAGAEREVVRERYTARRIKPGATVVRESAYGKQDISFTACDTAPATDDAAQWQGFGTALKPACEPIVMARKPLSESTVAANVLRWGTGALNIDGCRVETDVPRPGRSTDRSASGLTGEGGAITYGKYVVRGSVAVEDTTQGRWPANVIHDGSDEVLGTFPDAPGQQQNIDPVAPSQRTGNIYGKMNRQGEESADRRYTELGGTNFAALPGQRRSDSGSAARFFYTAKADDNDRLGSKHPTVKPVDLMQYLVRLVTPPRGLVLDPFAGTGTTGEACIRERMRAVLIEREEEYQGDIRRRMSLAMSGVDSRKRATAVAKSAGKPIDHGPLFGGTGDTPPVAKADRYTATSQIRTDDWTDRAQEVSK